MTSPSPVSPAVWELRRLLSVHERQLAALVEQQRRQRRQLEAACRRREDALLERLRRQLAAAELLAGPSGADSGDSSPLRPAEEPAGDGRLTHRRSPPPAPAADTAPGQVSRGHSGRQTSSGRRHRPGTGQ